MTTRGCNKEHSQSPPTEVYYRWTCKGAVPTLGAWINCLIRALPVRGAYSTFLASGARLKGSTLDNLRRGSKAVL
jgi:hypothetical protein